MTFAAGLLPGKKYVQIVVVKQEELHHYKKSHPKLSFFALPESASALGVGASRHWILQLARPGPLQFVSREEIDLATLGPRRGANLTLESSPQGSNASLDPKER